MVVSTLWGFSISERVGQLNVLVSESLELHCQLFCFEANDAGSSRFRFGFHRLISIRVGADIFRDSRDVVFTMMNEMKAADLDPVPMNDILVFQKSYRKNLISYSPRQSSV